jgi:riboflavin synthase
MNKHCDRYDPAKAYMTIAVSIGLEQEQLEHGLKIISKTIKEKKKKDEKKKNKK